MADRVFILGVGAVVTPGEEAAGGKVPLPPGMNARKARRLCRQSRLALFAADQAWRQAELMSQDGALFVALTHGSTSFLRDFHDYLFDHGPEAASPNAFAGGVAGAPLATISAHLGLTQGGTTLVGYEACGLELLNLAARKVSSGAYSRCLVGACEEYSGLVRDVYAARGWYPAVTPPHLPYPRQADEAPSGLGMAEGAAFAVLTPADGPPPTAPHLLYEPLDHALNAADRVDLVLSGASGGPQDRAELTLLEALLDRPGEMPALAFAKPTHGETFAVGPMLALELAWRILLDGEPIPPFPLHPSLRDRAEPLDRRPDKIMLVAADRGGQVQAGTLRAGTSSRR